MSQDISFNDNGEITLQHYVMICRNEGLRIQQLNTELV